jgi:AcrR family transcriptional regulator
MTTRRPVPSAFPQQRARDTHARILSAATRVFSRRGYQAATVDNIAEEAGTSMGAFYHHFPSKEALFRAILDDNIRRSLDELGRRCWRRRPFVS